MDNNLNQNKDLAKPSENSLGQLLLGLDGAALSKAIQNSNIPEKLIQSLPPQALYMAIQANDLENSRELIAASTHEQYQLMLDFELWSGDAINTDRFFNWLNIVDDQKSTEPLARFIRQVDNRLIAAIICRYVDAQVNEDQTEPPTNIRAYTPDNGYTWISINSGDPDRDRMIGRILAYICNTDPDYFYRLIYSPKVTTWSELEEESYGDRTRRLGDHGIPDHHTAWEINSPRSLDEIQTNLNEQKSEIKPPFISSYPIPHSLEKLEPLSSLLAEVITTNEGEALAVESSLTTMTNAGIVYYKIDFSDAEAVRVLIKKIRGAINIGIELTKNSYPEISCQSIYSKLKLEGLYRLGLGVLKKLRLFGESIKQGRSEQVLDPEISLTVETISALFPAKPVFLDIDQSGATELSTQTMAIETLSEVQQIRSYLEDKIHLT